MKFSLKKMLPAMLMALVLSVVMIVSSASAASDLNFKIVKAANPSETSAADGYAIKPASLASDGETVTLGFSTSVLYNIYGLSISHDGGTTYTSYTGTTSGGNIYYTFPIDDFGVNAKAKISVSVFGLYNQTHDIQIEWL
ncbi:hypothetical protein B1748_22705 [Paenibacillus sp. MY03]|uniref:NEAT domain-containing protein n=1 Tax=Paenibacillus sp. MY03 TaxID=302980 RepID=UPI000B3C7924|nr:NEAT domain-containing protein [Paenibacillus sp. MY03]OUS73287.1 hypothetical protein B1748_22705 [Paenibacillus sp. MY03]